MNEKEFLNKFSKNKIEWELLEFYTEIREKRYFDSYMSFSPNYGCSEVDYFDYADAIFLNDKFICWRDDEYPYINHEDFPFQFPQDYINDFIEYVNKGDIIFRLNHKE
jgi:hypothetical protein